MNMDQNFMWIHYERLHHHNKAKHNKTVCIFLGIYCIYIAAVSYYYRLGKVIPHATLWQYISWLYFMIDMFLCIAENIVRKQLTCLQITSLMSWSNDSSQYVGLHVSMEWRSQQWDTIHFWYQYSLSNEYMQLFLVVTQIANAHINISLTSIQHLNVRLMSDQYRFDVLCCLGTFIDCDDKGT